MGEAPVSREQSLSVGIGNIESLKGEVKVPEERGRGLLAPLPLDSLTMALKADCPFMPPHSCTVNNTKCLGRVRCRSSTGAIVACDPAISAYEGTDCVQVGPGLGLGVEIIK